MILRLVLMSMCGVAIGYAACGSPALAADYNRDIFKLRYPPKIHHYDSKKDKFVYIESVQNPIIKDNPGQDLGYYGNRLQQFRFIGPRERAGIYGAMDEYKTRMNFDPEKYPYRWRQ